jgi:hypothetical protein
LVLIYRGAASVLNKENQRKKPERDGARQGREIFQQKNIPGLRFCSFNGF